jgi:hypothetical protein
MATAVTDHPTTSAFRRIALWHRSAPRKLREAWYAGDETERWALWKKYVARHGKTLPFLASKDSPILWCWPEEWGRGEVSASVAALARWSEVFTSRPHGRVDLPQALQAVATAYALPQLAADLPGDAWWRLAEALYGLVQEAQQHSVDFRTNPSDVVRQQLLAGELPLAMSYLFPELRPMRSLRVPARQALSEGLDAMMDGDGTPHVRLLPVLGPLYACWTRTRWLGERLNRGAWSSDAETQYQWLIRRALRLTDGGRRFMLTDGDEKLPGLKPLLTMALELVGDKADRAAAAATISKSIVPAGRRANAADLPKASLNSEWSELAVLTAGWQKSAPRLAVAYGGEPLRAELHVGGSKLLAGFWMNQTTCDGRPVEPAGKWEESCWQSDKDCDFLELRIQLTEGLRLERQFILAKRDEILTVADIVIANDLEPRQLEHRFSLPLAVDVSWQPEIETRDGVLVAGKRRTAVLPLALFEWRSDPRGGSLASDGSRLTLAQSARGRALYCPLMFDLNAKRSTKERTWRQLTVAQERVPLAHDVAVGFRGHSGNDQFLIYRSLGPCGNRTLLGQNISNEFAAGRFRKSGLLDEWIEIEVIKKSE